MIPGSWRKGLNIENVHGDLKSMIDIAKFVKRYLSRSQKVASAALQPRMPLPPIIIPNYASTMCSPTPSLSDAATLCESSDEKDVFSADVEVWREEAWWKPDKTIETTLDAGHCVIEFAALMIAPEPKLSVSIREIRQRLEAEQWRKRFACEERPCGLKLLSGIRGTWEDFEEFSE